MSFGEGGLTEGYDEFGAMCVRVKLSRRIGGSIESGENWDKRDNGFVR